MAVSSGLRRLLRIRELEEEQNRQALESAMGELHRLEAALDASHERERRGRGLVTASARGGALQDRWAGVEESRAAGSYAAALGPMIAEAEQDVVRVRAEFLGKRVERRQAETLIEEAEAREAVEAARRGQQALDDWHSSRRHRQERETERAVRGADVSAANRET